MRWEGFSWNPVRQAEDWSTDMARLSDAFPADIHQSEVYVLKPAKMKLKSLKSLLKQFQRNMRARNSLQMKKLSVLSPSQRLPPPRQNPSHQ